MGTTPILGLPYPEPTDRLRNDAAATRALAEATEARLTADHRAQIAHADSATTTPGSGTPAAVDFPGVQEFMSGFSYAGGTLTYSGPLRLFLVSVEVQVRMTRAGAATPSLTSFVDLVVSGASVGSSRDEISVSGAEQHLDGRDVIHRVTVPVSLSSGDTVAVGASTNHPGVVGQTALRIYPIGPALA